MTYRLTVGPIEDGRVIAVITEGCHPQMPASGPCTVCTLEVVDEIPDRDVNAWFKRMVKERPWETRQ